MPKVSVLLSNYNGDKHLDESISSVLSQTYKDFEFIIVDDASTDSSRKVIENYHDKRIKKYYAEKKPKYCVFVKFSAFNGIRRIYCKD